MCQNVFPDEKSSATTKKIECLQLLFLLIPDVNYMLLKDLLLLLWAVAKEEAANKMSAVNLGTLFAPLLICPRKLSAEALQSNHQLMTRAVAFMIDEAKKLFELPNRLQTDLKMYLKNNPVPGTPKGCLHRSFRTPLAKIRASKSNFKQATMKRINFHE